MCLKLIHSPCNISKNNKGFLLGYKIFRKDKNGAIRSIYIKTKKTWKQGWNHSSRKNPRLTKFECETSEVNKGYHIFLNKNDAIRDMTAFFGRGYFVRQVCGKESDLVSLGDFCHYPSAVFTKLYVRFD